MPSEHSNLLLGNGQVPTLPRRRLLTRLFHGTGADGAPDPFAELEVSHALSKRSIELDADLDVHKQRSVLYRRLKTLENDATFEIAKVVKCRELCAQVEQLLHEDPVGSELLKAKIKDILREHESNHPTLFGE